MSPPPAAPRRRLCKAARHGAARPISGRAARNVNTARTWPRRAGHVSGAAARKAPRGRAQGEGGKRKGKGGGGGARRTRCTAPPLHPAPRTPLTRADFHGGGAPLCSASPCLAASLPLPAVSPCAGCCQRGSQPARPSTTKASGGRAQCGTATADSLRDPGGRNTAPGSCLLVTACAGKHVTVTCLRSLSSRQGAEGIYTARPSPRGAANGVRGRN